MFEKIKTFLVSCARETWRGLLGSHAFYLDRSTRNQVGLAFLGVALLAVWLTEKGLQAWAILRPDPDSPAWELALAARLLLFRAKVALGLILATVGLAWLAFQVLDRTRLGKRLWHWSQAVDSEASSAAKTLTAGIVFATLLLVFGFLAAQVLR